MNPQEIQALREKRTKLIADARTLNDTATADTPLSAEDDATVRKMLKDARAIASQVERDEELAQEEGATLPESQRSETDDAPAGDQSSETAEERQRYSAALRSYLRDGLQEISADDRKMLRAGYVEFQGDEKRAMSTLGAAAGGFTVFPDTRFGGRVMSALKAWGGVEAAGAEVITTDGGQDLPFITDDDTANVATIVAEEGSHAGGADVAFGQKVLKAYLYSTKVVKVSWQLLQDSSFDIEAHLAGKFGIRFGRGLNVDFTTGIGANKPEGVQFAAPIGRTAVVGNTTSIPADDIKRLKRSVDPAYRNAMARYMMNDNTALEVELLKDGQGRYLWQPSLVGEQPDRLNGSAVQINQDMPDMAASTKSMLFGDFSNYKIRRVRGMQVVRLNELYVENGQVGFLAFMRADGGLVDAGQNPIKAFSNSLT